MTKTLSERIAEWKSEINSPYDCESEDKTSEYFYTAEKLIEELQAENQALLAKNGELEKLIQEEWAEANNHAKKLRQDNENCYLDIRKLKSENEALEAKVKELEGKLQNIAIAHNVEECKKCDGWGWYADHDDMSTHSPADGSCQSCPVQVQCAECQATGFSPKPNNPEE